MLKLQLELVALRSRRQRLQQLERSVQLDGCFDERRALARTPARLEPEVDRGPEPAGFGEMPGDELRRSLADLAERPAQCLGDQAVQLAPLVAEQAGVGFILDK